MTLFVFFQTLGLYFAGILRKNCNFADSCDAPVQSGGSKARWQEWSDWMRSFMRLSNAPELRALSFNLTTNPPDS